MRNAWLPVVTVLGLQVGGLLAGAVITETVFGWGGVGRYVVDGDRQPRLLRGPEHDPDLRPRLPRGEPAGRHPVRVPQPADPVRLMAAPGDHDRAARRRVPRQPRAVGRRDAPAAPQQAGAARACSSSRCSSSPRSSRRSSPRTGRWRASLGRSAPAAVGRRTSWARTPRVATSTAADLYGAQVSLVAGVASVVMGVAIGGTIGALAGGIGGKVDSVLMRVVDVLLAIPGILLAIGIVAWLGSRPAADHVRGRHRQRADLRADPARQPAVPARIGLRHGVPRRSARRARVLLSGTCSRTR